MQISKAHFKGHLSPFFPPLLERGPHMLARRIAMKENIYCGFIKFSILGVLQISLPVPRSYKLHRNIKTHTPIYLSTS